MGKRVHILDDEPLVARLYARALQNEGWAIEISGDPFEAIDIISETPPDFILTDMNMPGMNAPEFIAELRRKKAKTMPILVLSASAPEEVVLQGLKAGADDFLQKGVPFSHLQSRVRFWLNAGVSGMTAHAREMAVQRLPNMSYVQHFFMLLDFPRSLTIERAKIALLDQFDKPVEDFNAIERMRLLGALAGVLAVLGRTDPVGYLKEIDLCLAVLTALNIDVRTGSWAEEWARFPELWKDPTFHQAFECLSVQPASLLGG